MRKIAVAILYYSLKRSNFLFDPLNIRGVVKMCWIRYISYDSICEVRI